MINLIHWIDSLPFRIKRILKSKSKKIVWGRVACLGKDTFDLFKNDEILYNNQKGRIDYLSERFVSGLKIKPSYRNLKYIKRKDIRRLIIEQFYSSVNFTNEPVLLLMDSYSELTDQKFIDKEESSSFFFANYTDLDINFRDNINCDGLLGLDENLIKYYIEFFYNFRSRYSKTPIVFINFPKKLETRQKFIERHDYIKDTIIKVSEKFENFYVLNIPDNLVENSSNDDFAYHFSSQAYEYLALNIIKLNVLNR
jgi:hypothetical protein